MTRIITDVGQALTRHFPPYYPCLSVSSVVKFRPNQRKFASISGSHLFMKIPLFVIVLVSCALSTVSAQEPVTVVTRYPQPPEAPDEVIALIEIPEGSINKYEIDEESGLLFLDRVMSMPLVYPINYGTFPSTVAGDGDPLDAMVFSRIPIHPGVLVRVRPVGVLRMIDGGEQDDKILCVPVSKVDPHYDGIVTIDDFPEIERQRIEAFFRVYKDLPAGRKKVELGGFGDVEEAKKLIREAMPKTEAEAPSQE